MTNASTFFLLNDFRAIGKAQHVVINVHDDNDVVGAQPKKFPFLIRDFFHYVPGDFEGRFLFYLIGFSSLKLKTPFRLLAGLEHFNAGSDSFARLCRHSLEEGLFAIESGLRLIFEALSLSFSSARANETNVLSLSPARSRRSCFVMTKQHSRRERGRNKRPTAVNLYDFLLLFRLAISNE